MKEDDIKRKLAKHYDRVEDGYSYNNRKLTKVENEGSIFFQLEGTPPKGYAIVTPELGRISLYDVRGRRFRIIDDRLEE